MKTPNPPMAFYAIAIILALLPLAFAGEVWS